MQYLRSLIFTAYLMLSACVFGCAMGLMFFLPYRCEFALARWWARAVLWMLARLCRLRYVVEGMENLPPGNHIAMSNHTSAWETVAAFVLLPPQVWVLKRELLWIPFVGWGLKRLRPIAIDRGAGHRAVGQVVEQGKVRLADGLWVVIFPEGTRVIAGQQRKYGVSGALLAAAAGKQIVPISHNAGEFWSRRGMLKKPGTIRLVIGRPIEPGHKEPRALTEEVRAAIEAGLARIGADTGKLSAISSGAR
ncbi:MAG TPA: lysophospholipid acyltransferase family protein [Steroidobacteraceae bacterium]|nr:lysophospholipid acyltransferase family protein [Steroidobacteraceae bacterium]